MNKCYMNHPVLEFDGVDGKLYGGNGFSPTVKAEWYIDLNPRKDVQPHRLYDTQDGGKYTNFPIVNMGVPNVKKLHHLVDAIVDALQNGASVHIGCIGGHGRTGLVLAVVVKRLTGNLNSVQWLRDNYCSKAVESKAQVDYLYDNFGITKVKPRYSPKPNWSGKI